jgi:hypothetical protein
MQQWMGREIACRQAVLNPDKPWPLPRVIADATVVIDPLNAAEFPSANTNHVEHLGTSGLASKAILDGIIDLYRSSGVSRFFVYVSPSQQAAELEGWLMEAGMEKTVELSVSWRPVSQTGKQPTPFEVRLCKECDAELLRHVLSADGDLFGSTAGTVDMLDQSHFYTLLASKDDAPAATGSLYIQRELAYLGNGKTLGPFRRQGAQSALIAARVDLAVELGCKEVVGETYRFLGSSYNNLVRAGFQELYSRAIYRWETGSTSS